MGKRRRLNSLAVLQIQGILNNRVKIAEIDYMSYTYYYH